jgi:transaldolase
MMKKKKKYIDQAQPLIRKKRNKNVDIEIRIPLTVSGITFIMNAHNQKIGKQIT